MFVRTFHKHLMLSTS